jgi:hypothetical protein
MPQKPTRTSVPTPASPPERVPRPVNPGDTHRHNVPPDPDEHEGATEDNIGDRTGPAAGYDEEPAQVKDRGGVS